MDDPKQKIAALLMGIDRNTLHGSIGRFMFEFSQMEYSLRYYASEILDLPDKHWEAAMAGYNFAYLVRLCEQVFGDFLHNDEAKRKEIADALHRCLAINDERVRVAHGTWISSPYGNAAIHMARNSLKTARHFVEPKALDRLADECVALRAKIDNMYATAAG